MSKLQATAVILAGGRSSRMGTDKALLDWGGRPLIAAVADSLTAWFECVVVIAAQAYPFLDLPQALDETPGLGPLGGLEAGLAAARHPLAFVCACDMPFLQERFVRHLVEQGAGPYDAIVPMVRGRYEPLCAVYSTRTLPTVRAMLAARDLKLQTLLERIRVRAVPESEWATFGPGERLFFNCNTPADFKAARRMC